jgi:hypothetical protein
MRPNHHSIVRALEANASIRERFWASVSNADAPEGCWVWTGSIRPGTHPVFSVSRYCMTAARVAWFMETGELPAGGRMRQRCGNQLCVRPSHFDWHIGRRTKSILNSMSDGYVQPTQRVADEEEAA